MALWTAEVEEIRHYRVLYTVEAKDAEEAADKMLGGETEEEFEVELEGVIDRHLRGEPRKRRQR